MKTEYPDELHLIIGMMKEEKKKEEKDRADEEKKKKKDQMLKYATEWESWIKLLKSNQGLPDWAIQQIKIPTELGPKECNYCVEMNLDECEPIEIRMRNDILYATSGEYQCVFDDKEGVWIAFNGDQLVQTKDFHEAIYLANAAWESRTLRENEASRKNMYQRVQKSEQKRQEAPKIDYLDEAKVFFEKGLYQQALAAAIIELAVTYRSEL